MEGLIVGLFTLAGVYFGSQIAKGKDVFEPIRKMKFAVRTEAQEAELNEKLMKQKDINKHDGILKGAIPNG